MIQPGISFHKTRIAPTPSGYLHLGNILSFVTTAELAKQTGAQILLRIDDLDRQRVHREYVEDIFETLHFMGIEWDEGPRDYHEYETRYSQVHRMHLYQNALQQLMNGDHLFACTCSRTQLHYPRTQHTDAEYHGACINKQIPYYAEQASWRISTPAKTTLQVKTLQGNVTTTLPDDMNNIVVKKKDGYPSYHLASIVDDLHYGIDLIVRGEDLWPSTIAQLHVASLLPSDVFAKTTFHHHALLTAPTGQKLSKSAGDTSIKYLRSKGMSREDVWALAQHMQKNKQNSPACARLS